MGVCQLRTGLAGLVLIPALCGCLVPQSQVDALRTQNRSLSQQHQAQATQIENLQTHNRKVEDQLARAEESLALLEERQGLTQQQLANFRHEREQLHEHFRSLAAWKTPVPPEVNKRLAEISQRFNALQFDAKTGIGKLDTDILFDSGSEDLKPGGERVLAELVQLMKSPEAKDLKMMVVGHTDDRAIAGRPVREKFPTNFHLSAGRALSVADHLRRLGMPEDRMGVAGFGKYQPLASNVTPQDRRKNRRVEIFVMPMDVPVIGWSETIPSVY